MKNSWMRVAVALLLTGMLFPLTSCKKEHVEPQIESLGLSPETVNLRSSEVDEGDGLLHNRELPGIDVSLIRPADQYFINAFVDFLYDLNGNGRQWGEPIVDAIIVEFCEGETTALVPFVTDASSDEVSHIMLYFEAEDGDFDYYIIPRTYFESLNNLQTVPLSTIDPQQVFTGTDMAFMFDKYDEVLFGKPGPGAGPVKSGIGEWGIWPWNWGRGVACPSAAGGRRKPHFRPNRPNRPDGPGDPADFEGFATYLFFGGRGGWYNTNGGGSIRPVPGGGNTLNPPYFTDILRLQNCEGYLDPMDTGDNPGVIHTDFTFCSSWMPYLSRCLNSYDSFEDIVESMAMLRYYHEDIYSLLLNADMACNSKAIVDLIFTKKRPGGYDLSTEEVRRLLRHPELILPLQTFLEPYQYTGVDDAKEGVLHQLLNQDPQHLTPELIQKVDWFFGEYHTVWDNITQRLLALNDLSLADRVITSCQEQRRTLIEVQEIINDIQSTQSTLNDNDSKSALLEHFENVTEECNKYLINFYGDGGITEQINVNEQCKWIHSYWNGHWNLDVSYIFDPISNSWTLFDRRSATSYNPHIIDVLIGASLELGHTSLDIAGLVPVVGEIADGINAVWYYAEGDYTNAGLASLSMIPFIGSYTGLTKITKNSLKILRQGATEFFQSPSGLLYKIGNNASPTTIDRLGHVFEHASDNLIKPLQGVFDDPQNVVGKIDEAYGKFLNNQDVVSNIIETTNWGETRRVITVNMNSRIGWEGGYQGTGAALTHLKIVIVEGTTNVITAFPVPY